MSKLPADNEGNLPSHRKPFFAMKAQRLLFKSCMLADLGDPAFVLYSLIATTEDATRYRGPVGYWDRQIANELGWSDDKVVRVRSKLIKAGLLKYERTHSRKQGRYQVLIPESILHNLDDSPVEPDGELEEMVRMGAEYQPPKDRMAAEYQATIPRNGADPPADHPADHPADPTTLTLSRTLSSCPRSKFADEDMATASQIWDLIQALQPNRKKPNLDSWANTVRLMGERDGRTQSQILDLFRWANRDSFWRTNILSPAKLREKWDDLQLKRQAKTSNGKPEAKRKSAPPSIKRLGGAK